MVNYPSDLSKPEILSFDNGRFQRVCPLTEKMFLEFFDDDGRLVDEHRFRQAVFRGTYCQGVIKKKNGSNFDFFLPIILFCFYFSGGVTPSIRKSVWKYLFHMYPFHSTKR